MERTMVMKNALCAATALSALAMGLPANAQDFAGDDVDVIYVTATKRVQTLADVPFSLAAYNQEALLKQGIDDFADIAFATAGVTIQEGGPGFRGIYIRGIVSERGNGPTTGFYIGESFLPAGGIVQSFIEPDFFDLNRIEILRGPQGTVFGGSSLGGTVRAIPNDPDTSDLSVSLGTDLSFTKSGGFNPQVNAVVNAPVVPDRVALRVSGTYRHTQGYIDELIGDFSGPNRSPVGDFQRQENVNDAEFFSVRAAIRFEITPNVTFTPSVLIQESEVDAISTVDFPTGTLDVRRGTDIQELVSDDFVLGNALFEWSFGDYQLTSSTSYSERDSRFLEDVSDIINAQFSVLLPAVVDGPSEESLFTQELRVATTGDQRLQFVGGFFYEDFEREGTISQAEIFFLNTVDTERQQIAIFGEATYAITDALKVTAGLRYFNYDVDVSTDGGPIDRSDEDGFNPRVSVSYNLNDENLVYATVSKGFRPGGPNRAVPPALIPPQCFALFEQGGIPISEDGQIGSFQSDSVWNYEGGAKLSAAGGRYSANVAGYFIRWKDIQQLFFPPGCGVGGTGNLGEADIVGAEIEFNLQPADAFRLFGSINYNDATFDGDTPLLGITDGQSIQNAPKWGINLNGEVNFSGPKDSDGFVVVSYRFNDNSFRDNARNAPERFQESFSTVGLRAGLDFGQYSLTAYVDNLTNEQPRVTNFLSTFGVIPGLGRERFFTLQPRTIGLRGRVDF
ncbi:MAG: TonB-dependent receptor [Pseudomonadota bacterium]